MGTGLFVTKASLLRYRSDVLKYSPKPWLPAAKSTRNYFIGFAHPARPDEHS